MADPQILILMQRIAVLEARVAQVELSAPPAPLQGEPPAEPRIEIEPSGSAGPAVESPLPAATHVAPRAATGVDAPAAAVPQRQTQQPVSTHPHRNNPHFQQRLDRERKERERQGQPVASPPSASAPPPQPALREGVEDVATGQVTWDDEQATAQQITPVLQPTAPQPSPQPSPLQPPSAATSPQAAPQPVVQQPPQPAVAEPHDAEVISIPVPGSVSQFAAPAERQDMVAENARRRHAERQIRMADTPQEYQQLMQAEMERRHRWAMARVSRQQGPHEPTAPAEPHEPQNPVETRQEPQLPVQPPQQPELAETPQQPPIQQPLPFVHGNQPPVAIESQPPSSDRTRVSVAEHATPIQQLPPQASESPMPPVAKSQPAIETPPPDQSEKPGTPELASFRGPGHEATAYQPGVGMVPVSETNPPSPQPPAPVKFDNESIATATETQPGASRNDRSTTVQRQPQFEAPRADSQPEQPPRPTPKPPARQNPISVPIVDETNHTGPRRPGGAVPIGPGTNDGEPLQSLGKNVVDFANKVTGSVEHMARQLRDLSRRLETLESVREMESHE